MFDVTFAAFVVGLVLLIFLLSLLLSAANGQQSEGDGEASEGESPQQQQGDPDYQKLAATIADAIHAYRRYRRADERNRSNRERVTVVVLGITAIFAFFAAGAAIYSAVIVAGQLHEMREDKRAWIGFSKLEVKQDGDITIVSIPYGNLGKTPALLHLKTNQIDARAARDIRTVAVQNRVLIDLYKVCPQRPVTGRLADTVGFFWNDASTIFPGAADSYRVEFKISNQNTTGGWLTACLAYETVGKIHYSGACYYWLPENAPKVRPCNVGGIGVYAN